MFPWWCMWVYMHEHVAKHLCLCMYMCSDVCMHIHTCMLWCIGCYVCVRTHLFRYVCMYVVGVGTYGRYTWVLESISGYACIWVCPTGKHQLSLNPYPAVMKGPCCSERWGRPTASSLRRRFLLHWHWEGNMKFPVSLWGFLVSWKQEGSNQWAASLRAPRW